MMIVGWIMLSTFINGVKNGTSTPAGKGKLANSALISTSKNESTPLSPASQRMRKSFVLGFIKEKAQVFISDNVILIVADV